MGGVVRKRKVKQGDTKRRRWELSDANGPIDLTGATEVRMLAALAPGQTADGGDDGLNGVCQVESPPTDGVVLEPAGGTGALGLALFNVEFQITSADGSVETVPDEGYVELQVLADLGP